MLYYDKNDIKVRKSSVEDVEYLKDHLRESDTQEIWASNHLTPEKALRLSLAKSIFCLTVENGAPIAMFGINPEQLLGERAVVWLLGSEGLNKIRIPFIRYSRHFISMMLEYYPYLHNYVDARNLQSIAWLKFCEATIEEAKPFGSENLPFHYFYFRRKEND